MLNLTKRLKQKPSYPRLFFLLTIFFSSFLGFSTSVNGQCPNNVSSPSGCPTATVGVIDVAMGVPPSFCVNPSDSGCGTIRFTNLESTVDCPVELCFRPSQGCGVAGTNLCIYESDGMGGCNFLLHVFSCLISKLFVSDTKNFI